MSTKTETLSVTEYAEQQGVVRQTIIARIHNKKLGKGVSAKKVGAIWVIKVKSKVE